ncbi:SRPBCC family protein [Pelagibacterium luteolum]|uniref:Uncharacterized conserved protein YndB, AHSA1/START domain n=1 Tax=Pelagibacterium luteolum TaxID=440168 RepID=A0A1G7WG03_9HYPH|nr:SRPBCC family protein [Pelagibacterium luteolum]SDG70120.1 Uncharacterized conserved protein YndB, AHSA1/START domain [Pelagibacterium luteolum]
MNRAPDRFLRMTRRYKAPIERVYNAWLDPRVTRTWLFTSSASDSNSTEIDARVGGKWTITDVREGITYTALGEYLELDPPHRIVFTFAMPQFSPNSDTITVELSQDGDETVMVFTQSGGDIASELENLPEDETQTSEHGWNLMFVALGHAVEA